MEIDKLMTSLNVASETAITLDDGLLDRLQRKQLWGAAGVG